MFYKKKGKPEIGEIVICTVKKILYHSIFISIDDYENLEGMVHISEIAPGRIRNLRDYVTEGKRIVCKVLNINPQGNIDLSLRRVTTTAMVNKLNEFKQDEKAEKLLELIGKDLNMDLKKIYDEVGFKAIAEYGGLYPFLQAIVDQGKSVIDQFTINIKLSEALFRVVKDKIKPVEVSVRGILYLQSLNSNGVDDIKSILLQARGYNVKITYLGAPRYKLEVVSQDYKKAETSLKGFLDFATVTAKKLGCELNFVKND